MLAAARILRSPVLLLWVCMLFGANTASAAVLPSAVRSWLSATPPHTKADAANTFAAPAHRSVQQEPADAPVDDDLKGTLHPALATTPQCRELELPVAYVSTPSDDAPRASRVLTPLGPRPPPLSF